MLHWDGWELTLRVDSPLAMSDSLAASAPSSALRAGGAKVPRPCGAGAARQQAGDAREAAGAGARDILAAAHLEESVEGLEVEDHLVQLQHLTRACGGMAKGAG